MTSPTRAFRSIEPGQIAPGFTLPAAPGGTVSLADYRGHRVLLVFYMGDFIGDDTNADDIFRTTAINLSALSADIETFAALDICVLAVARESPERHAAVARLLDLRFPLVSDTTGDLGVAYGVLAENRWAGSNYWYDRLTTVFLIDRAGVIRLRLETDFITSTAPASPLVTRLASRPSTSFGPGDEVSTTDLTKAAVALTT
jgi:thioredoxin-dependent peroxiredoxin